MSITLRLVLIAASIIAAAYTFRKIHKSQLNIDDAVYWIVLSVILIIISIFPGIANAASKVLGFISTSNFVFLVMIFLAIVKLFKLSIDLSIAKHRLNSLVQRTALLEKHLEERISELEGSESK